jgi:hypothetical protein
VEVQPEISGLIGAGFRTLMRLPRSEYAERALLDPQRFRVLFKIDGTLLSEDYHGCVHIAPMVFPSGRYYGHAATLDPERIKIGDKKIVHAESPQMSYSVTL